MEDIISKKARTTPFLTKEEIGQLFDRLAAGDKRAEKILFESHLALVRKLALRIANLSILGVEDLEQEGAIGLLQAIRQFDHKRNGDFLLFAYFAVNQTIIRALVNYSPAMRVPQNKIRDARNFKKVADQLNQKLCRQASFEEIAAACGVSVKEVVSTWSSVYNGAVYLSEQVPGKNEKLTYADTLVDESSKTTDNETEVGEKIMDIVYQLDEREQQVLKLYFGLKNRNDGYNSCLSFWDIGQRLDKKLSGERVRQIKNQALNKIRRKIKKHLSLQSFAELDKTLGAGDKQVKTSL